ncbi:MAG: amidohydrolase/deacetylase family metallohydrolase [Pseudomonadota bacterium]
MAGLLIKGGQVFSGADRSFRQRDVLIDGGKIARVDQTIEPDQTVEVIDAAGKLVSAGLIDFHMHAFRYGHFLSVDTDDVAPSSGTTTFVDAGSAGSLHFLAFREYVIKPARSRILAFLNISAIGQTTDGVTGLGFHDCDDERLLHVESARETIEKNREYIVGVKVRAYTNIPSMRAMERARELADLVGLPIMVHTAPAPPTFEEVIAFLKPGDIITHPYHGGATTTLDADSQVLPEYWAARERGIEVDLGLDRFHGLLPIMQACVAQGYYPDYISTDLTTTNRHTVVFDMPTTMSKLMACGMSLEEVFARSTIDPARKLGLADEIGELREGAPADVAIFELDEGEHVFHDYEGNTIAASQRIVAEKTFKDGALMVAPDRETEVPEFLNMGNPWKNY